MKKKTILFITLILVLSINVVIFALPNNNTAVASPENNASIVDSTKDYWNEIKTFMASPDAKKIATDESTYEIVDMSGSVQRHEDIEEAMLRYVNILRAEKPYALPMDENDKVLQENSEIRVMELKDKGLCYHDYSDTQYPMSRPSDLYCKCENVTMFEVTDGGFTAEEWAVKLVEQISQKMGCMVGSHNAYGLTVISENNIVYVAWEYASK